MLIERTRSAVTVDQGRYRLVDLRPGVYKVTFTLAGFTTVVRDGIELPGNFVATVNVALRVGALEETVTVSGASPLVDVQQASKTQVLTRNIIDSLPTTRNVMSVGILVHGHPLPETGHRRLARHGTTADARPRYQRPPADAAGRRHAGQQQRGLRVPRLLRRRAAGGDQRDDERAAGGERGGTHNLKVGFQDSTGPDDIYTTRKGDLIENYVNGRPQIVTVFNSPTISKAYVNYDVGLYAQDSWTLKRLTINPGLRIEYFKSSMAETSMRRGASRRRASTPSSRTSRSGGRTSRRA